MPRFSFFAAAAGAVLLAAGCATPPPTSVAPRVTRELSKPAPAAEKKTATIYLPTISDDELKLARKTVALPPGAGQRDAIQALLDSEAGGQRIYPAGTRVVSYTATGSGEAVLTLSKEIRDFSGGSAEEAAAVNALVLTTVEAYPNTRTVTIKAADGDLETLGGHLDLTQPLEPDRQSVIKGS